MISAALVDLRANRWNPFAYVIAFKGVDLTGAVFHMQVRAFPDQAGAPLIDLPTVTDPTAQGVRFINVDTTGETPTSYIRLQIPGASLGTAVNLTIPAGGDQCLSYDLLITPQGRTQGRWLYGSFVIVAGQTQLASAALADDPAPNASDAIVVLDGEKLSVSLAGLELIGPLYAAAKAAQASADADALAAAASAAQAATRALPVSYSPPFGVPFSLDFASPDAIEGTLPSVVVSIPPAQATIDDHSLTVVRDWGSGDAAGHVFAPSAKFGEGVLRALVQRRPFMIEQAHADFTRLAIWSEDAEVLKVGTIDAANMPTTFGSCRLGATQDAGVEDEDIYVELTRGPMVAGTGMILRTWRPSEVYANPGIDGAPDSPGYTVPLITGGTTINEGFISISSFIESAKPAKVRRVDLIDARYGIASVSSKAYLVGRWFSRFEAFFPVMATTRGGSKLRSRLSGSATLSIRYAVPSAQQYAPVLDVFVNGARTSGPVSCGGQSGTLQSQQLLSGLDPSQTYQVELRVRGVEETDDKWNRGAGLLVQDLVVDSGAHIEPWVDSRPKMLFIGDSITEGISGRGDPSRPLNSGGDASYPVLFCEAMGLQPIVNGFGGTGLLTVGNGNMPVTATNAFFYMNDRPIDTAAEAIAYAAINLGTNDIFKTNASATDFRAAADSFLRKLLSAHPSLRGVYWLRPFNDDCAARYAGAIQDVVRGIGRASVQYVDTTGWNLAYAQDTVHPLITGGHDVAALRLQQAVGTMAVPAY